MSSSAPWRSPTSPPNPCALVTSGRVWDAVTERTIAGGGEVIAAIPGDRFRTLGPVELRVARCG